jgi:hypothetical protein
VNGAASLPRLYGDRLPLEMEKARVFARALFVSYPDQFIVAMMNSAPSFMPARARSGGRGRANMKPSTSSSSE